MGLTVGSAVILSYGLDPRAGRTVGVDVGMTLRMEVGFFLDGIDVGLIVG